MTKPGLYVPESIQLSENRSQDDRSECASTESVAEMDRNIDTLINSETGTFIISKKKTESSCNQSWLNNLMVDYHKMRKRIGTILFLSIPLILIIGLPERVDITTR